VPSQPLPLCGVFPNPLLGAVPRGPFRISLSPMITRSGCFLRLWPNNQAPAVWPMREVIRCASFSYRANSLSDRRGSRFALDCPMAMRFRGLVFETTPKAGARLPRTARIEPVIGLALDDAALLASPSPAFPTSSSCCQHHHRGAIDAFICAALGGTGKTLHFIPAAAASVGWGGLIEPWG